MTFGDIVDKLLDKYRFTYTSTSKQTDFTTFGIRFDKVDYFDTGEKHFGSSRKFFKFRGFTVDRQTIIAIFWQVAKTVYTIANYVEEATIDILTYRHFDRATGSDNFGITAKPFGRIHRDGSYHIFAYVRLYF